MADTVRTEPSEDDPGKKITSGRTQTRPGRKDNTPASDKSEEHGPSRTSGFQFQDIAQGQLFNPPYPRGSRQPPQFQYHQIPVPPSQSPARNGGQPPPNNGVRSRSSIPESGHTLRPALCRNGSSLSMLTSPLDFDVFPPPSPCSTKSSLPGVHYKPPGYQGHPGSHYRDYNPPSKPKKWFSFSNLLNRQNLSSLLNLPSKTRLSVSSTLNSVFVGPGGSPSPSEGGSEGGNVFFGLNFSSFDKSGDVIVGKEYPISPSGRPGLSGPDQGQNPGQVVYRRKSGSSEQRCSTSSGGVLSSKHYSSGGESIGSERSSGSGGIGYYTVNSGCGGGPGSGSGSSRLSCGEFFTGTPNSPINSLNSGRGDLDFNYREGGGGPSGSMSGFSSRNGESCSYSRDFYHFHKNLGRSLPTLLGKSNL